MIDKQLSEKIRIGSFLCTFLVILRHSLNLQAFGFTESNNLLSFVENGISKQTEVAVPFFFIVSGFFFLRVSYSNKTEYGKMLNKKVQTLFVPFLFWNIIGVVPLLIAHQFDFAYNKSLYLVQLLHSDWNGVLWYVRDIMTFMLLAPLYMWVFKLNNKWLYLVVFGILFYYWVPVDCSWMSSEGMLFFFIGGVLQKNVEILYRVKNMPKNILVILFLLWFFSCFLFPRLWIIHRYNTLLGVVVLWCLLDKIPLKIVGRVLDLSMYSFFIYVVHLDIIKLMKIGVASFFYQNQFIAFVSFFILPVATLIVCLFIGRNWHRYFPTTFSIVTGGRG